VQKEKDEKQKPAGRGKNGGGLDGPLSALYKKRTVKE
jgi:hypothetical protein